MMGPMTRLIAIVGSSPGIGKSTACTHLARRLRDAGLRVDHFAEEDILTRPAFAPVAWAFTETGVVAPEVLLSATTAFVAEARRGGWDVVVADALVPYVPSLRAWGHSEAEIAAFLDDLEAVLRPLDPAFCFLDGDPAEALPRAIEREEPGWADWFVDKLSRYEVTPPVHDLPSAVDYLADERAAFRRLLARAGWRVHLVSDAHRRSVAELDTALDVMVAAERLLLDTEPA